MKNKALSLPILISLVVGNMIGTGIYILPASLAEYGTTSLFSWAFTSIGAILVALTFANLAKRFPKTGGPYVHCKETYGNLTGFIVAYIYWLSYVVSIAGIAVASVGYLGFLWPEFNANSVNYSPALTLSIELGIVWLFTLINIIGMHGAGIIQVGLTLIKLAPLLLIIIVGLGSTDWHSLAPAAASHESTFGTISTAATLTFWAFIGLESATVPAENASSHRNIYRATVYGTILTAIIYILSSVVLMGIIPTAELSQSQFPFANAGTLLFGHGAAVIITLCAFVSGLGALNACTLIVGQVAFAAARDNLLPNMFSKLSRHNMPITSQLVSCGLISLFLIMSIAPTLLEQFNQIALLSVLLTLLSYLASALCELKILLIEKTSWKKRLLNKPVLVTLGSAAYCLWMVSSFTFGILSAAGLLTLFCIPMYFAMNRNDLTSEQE